MSYTFATLIVAAADQLAAQELFGTTTTDPDTGAVVVTPNFNVFVTGLSADGTAPATHYVSAGPFDNSELNKALNQQAVPFWVSFGPEPDFNGMQIVQAADSAAI